MKKIKATYQQEKLTRWLLVLALFFSPFTYSTAAGNLQSGKPGTQIELLISNRTAARKQSIRYKRISKLLHTAFYHTPQNRLNDLFTYNTLIKVKLAHSARPFYLQDPAGLFRPSKTIPQDLDEEILLTFPG